jgi:hypothetical protein
MTPAQEQGWNVLLDLSVRFPSDWTTHRQLFITPRVAGSMSPAASLGRATTDSQMSFHADSNNRIGSSRTGYRTPKSASSDMPVRRQVTTPSINGHEAG